MPIAVHTAPLALPITSAEEEIEYQGGQIQCGSGSITGSTVYKYSYDVLTGSSSDEGTVVYDASGNATEQPQ